MSNAPRMRTYQQAATIIKELDPDTSVTPYRIRAWLLDGTLPHVQAGSKRLVNVDMLLDKLSTGELFQASHERGIRRIGG